MKLNKIFRYINFTSLLFVNKHLLASLVICVSVILFLSCSGDKKGQPENNLKSSAQHKMQQNTQSGNETLNIKICELVPDELVAKTLGGKTISPAQVNDLGPSHGCTYTIDPAGPDNMEMCIVWLNPPSTFTSPEDELETAHGLGQEATAESLEGFGDKAFVVHNKTEEQSIVFVLLKDKVSLQVGVEHFDDAKKLTGLIMSKLKEM